MTLEVWLEELAANQEETLHNRRYLHAHPELSFEEKATSAFIIEQLQSYGVEEIYPNAGNGASCIPASG